MIQALSSNNHMLAASSFVLFPRFSSHLHGLRRLSQRRKIRDPISAKGFAVHIYKTLAHAAHV
jgi:hypothetical protein